MTRPSRTSRVALLLADHNHNCHCKEPLQGPGAAHQQGSSSRLWTRMPWPMLAWQILFLFIHRSAAWGPEPASLNTKSFGSRCPTSAVLRMSDLSGNVPMCRVSRLPRRVKHRPRRHRPHSETVVRVLRQAREEKELSETVKPPKLGTKTLGLLKP